MSLVDRLPAAARLMRATLVISHAPNDRVRYKTEAAEQAFGQLIGGPAKATNVALDDPPEVPRLALKQASKVLTLANSRIQLALSFQERRLNADVAYQVVEKNIRSLFERLPQYESLDNVGEIGLVVELAYPLSADPREMSTGMAEELYKGPKLGEILSFDMRLGFDTNEGLYVNMGFGVYEFRTGRFTGTRPPSLIDITSLDVEERGLAVNIDVNNKPSALATGYRVENALEKLVQTSKDLALHGHRKFLGVKQ